MAVQLGHGSKIVFGTSSLSLELLSIDGPNLERAFIEVSNMSTTTGYKEFLPSSLIDPGDLSFTFHYDGQDPTTALSSTGETITIYLGSTSTGGFSAAGTGALTAFAPNVGGYDDALQGSGTVKYLGAITWATIA